LKKGNIETIDLVCKEEKKWELGFMVAGGMSARKVGKLIFCVGKVNVFAYYQSLDYFREDIATLGEDLYFQQDGAKSHTCTVSMEKIGSYFPKKLKFCPANLQVSP
jgi:hypothetical protein